MYKNIYLGKEGQDKLLAGVDKLANVVKTTLGPGGTNVIVQLGDNQIITKDGVSVANQIFLSDPVENMGAQIVKKVAQKTVEQAGDGTTTATVLAQAILHQGMKVVDDEGVNPIVVKREIDAAVEKVVAQLRQNARAIPKEDIHKVAIISANGDKTIGNLVADAIMEVGLEGIVTVENSNSNETYNKKIDGMRWDRGYMSHHFITDVPHSESFLEDPVILIYDGPINSLREIMSGKNGNQSNIIERYRKNPETAGKPLLIIAHDFGAELVTTMVHNHRNGAIQCCLVQAPEFKDTRKSIMEDIAAATGATVVSRELGLTWDKVNIEHLGRCDSVRVTQWNTTIIGGKGGLMAGQRAQAIREQMEQAEGAALASLKARLARLVDGIMAIYVGGSSDVEVEEKKDRIDDAVNATRAALEEGILPGGGVAYLRARKAVEAGETYGEGIIYAALAVPFMAICENVAESGGEILTKLGSDPDVGFNAATLKIENLVDAGVIDPVKVSRLALENAASAAGMLLTTKSVVALK